MGRLAKFLSLPAVDCFWKVGSPRANGVHCAKRYKRGVGLHITSVRVSSSFFTTSLTDRSRSLAIDRCFAAGYDVNISHRSPSTTSFTGMYADRFDKWSRPARTRLPCCRGGPRWV